MPASGGDPVQITKSGGGDAWESEDGKLLYCTKVPSEGPGLWGVPVDGGEERKVLDGAWFKGWEITKGGIFFGEWQAGEDDRRPIKFFDFKKPPVEVGFVEKPPRGGIFPAWRSARMGDGCYIKTRKGWMRT